MEAKGSKNIERDVQGSLWLFLTPTLGLAAKAFSHPRIWGQRVLYLLVLPIAALLTPFLKMTEEMPQEARTWEFCVFATHKNELVSNSG